MKYQLDLLFTQLCLALPLEAVSDHSLGWLQINPSLSWESFTEVDFLVGISVSIILSAVAIVFMARKSDTQSFLSVEDFWGGVANRVSDWLHWCLILSRINRCS